MVTLRPRERKAFTGFTAAEIEKMENLLKEQGEESLDREFYLRLTKHLNCCNDRSGKSALKLAEVETWFQDRLRSAQSNNGVRVNTVEKPSCVPEACPKEELQFCATTKACFLGDTETGGNVPDFSKMKFEARSSIDKAWYDVEAFLTYRCTSSGNEVRVRYDGFGADHDEWVNVEYTRVRSIPLEHSECGKLKVGDLVVCFQESEETAKYFDAHILAIQPKMHDIRGCRCLFLIRYDHDSTQERVRLNRLCCRPLGGIC